MLFGPDFSNYGGQLRPEVIACWKAHAPPITLAIAGTQNRAITRQQLAVCRDGGLRLEAYAFLYPDLKRFGPMTHQVEQAALTVCGFRVERFWLDFEDPPPQYGAWPPPAATVGLIAEAVEATAAAHLQPGIYTGRPFWVDRTGNSTAFAHLPLLHADYGPFLHPYDFDNLPDLDAWRPYGGFELHTWQFHNTTDLCGFSVDLNLRRDEENEMERFNGTVARFNAEAQGVPSIIMGDGREIVNVADFGLDFVPKMIRIELFKLAGGFVGIGDGQGGAYAYSLEAGETHGQADVFPDAGGNFTLDCYGGFAFRRAGLGILGYVR